MALYFRCAKSHRLYNMKLDILASTRFTRSRNQCHLYILCRTKIWTYFLFFSGKNNENLLAGYYLSTIDYIVRHDFNHAIVSYALKPIQETSRLRTWSYDVQKASNYTRTALAEFNHCFVLWPLRNFVKGWFHTIKVSVITVGICIDKFLKYF